MLASTDVAGHVLVHTGLPKTGTTTIQAQLAADGRLAFFGPSARETSPLRQRVVDPLLFGDDARFHAESVPAARELLARGGDNRPIVLSDEVLTWGQHAKRAARWNVAEPVPAARTARRLAELFPGATVLIVVRNQLDWICSHFLQMEYIMNMTMDFDTMVERGIRSDDLYTFDEILMYDKLFDAYRDAFGANRVRIAFFEEVADDLRRLVEDVYEMVNLPLNAEQVRASHLNTRSRVHPAARKMAGWLLPLNRIKAAAPEAFAAAKALMPGHRRDVTPTEWQRRAIAARYGPANRRFAERLGRALPPGYPGAQAARERDGVGAPVDGAA